MTLNTPDIRWKQRFENLQAAHKTLQQAVDADAKTPGSMLIQMAVIKSFEISSALNPFCLS